MHVSSGHFNLLVQDQAKKKSEKQNEISILKFTCILSRDLAYI